MRGCRHNALAPPAGSSTRARPPHRTAALVLALLLSVLAPGPAAAQPADAVDVPANTPGWFWGGVGSPALAPAPSNARSTEAGAWSLRTNPGGLAFTQGFESSVSAEVTGTDRPAIGWMTSVGTGRGFGLGLGVDRLDPRWGRSALRWGLALGSERWGLGVTRVHWRGLVAATQRETQTTDVGLQLRATRWLALGFTGENLEDASLGALASRRAWTVAASTRMPSGLVELDLATTFPEGGHSPLVAGTFVARLPGFRIHTRAAWSTGDRVAAWGEERWQVQAGAELVLGPTSVGGGILSSGDGVERSYVTASAHLPFRRSFFSSRSTLLRVDLAGPISERGSTGLFSGESPGFVETLDQLRRLIHDDSMAGVYLSLGGVTASGAQLWELRRTLDAIRAAGRLVVVHLAQAGVRDLYLAGNADYVTVAPNVQVLDGGFRVERFYLGDLLDRLGIEANFVRIGPWKSAPERFVRSGPSDEANDDLDRFLDTAWALLARGIGTRAELSADQVDELLGRLPLLPDDLVTAGLADAIAWNDEIPALLQQRFGRRLGASRTWGGFETRREEFFPALRVAVLHVDGAIVDGRGGWSLLSGGVTTGDLDIQQACEAIAARSDIDVVLLRVQSGGGSALASDRMLHALRRLARQRTVIVSLASTAASGGYYVAALPAPVYAAPNTLTGSIGIYAGAVSADALLARLGVRFDRRTRGGASDLFGLRPWTDDERAIAQRSMDAAYRRFIELVAEVRPRTVDEIDAVAQGHIWSGEAALEHGLVDELSGLPGALDRIRTEAGLPPGTPAEFLAFPDRSLFRIAAGGFQLVRSDEPDTAPWVGAWPALDRLVRLLEPSLTASGQPMAHLPVHLDGF